MIELFLAYGAGLLTLINPCVLPVLPIVLAGSLQSHRSGPLVLALGLSISFVFLGVTVTAFGHAVGLTEDSLITIGAVLMIGFGLMMLVPRLGGVLATATAGMSSRADSSLDGLDQSGLKGQFFGGMLLGAVWTPCIGPTLGGAIALASQQEQLGRVTLTMTAFALGVSTIVIALGYGARAAIMRRQALMRQLATSGRPILGGVFVVSGIAIFFRIHHFLEGALLGVLPAWLVDLSVRL